MKNNTKKLEDHTLEELIQKKTKLKNAYIGLGSVMVIACIALLYLAFAGKNFALIAVAATCACSLVPGFISIATIEKEIKSRNQ
jgi:hypothetical protein